MREQLLLEAELAQPDVEIGLGTGLRATAEKIILAAIKRRASDIHVIPGNGSRTHKHSH